MREPALDLSPSPGDDVRHTTCYMCACRCGIKVWLKDGRIRYIQGNPEHPVNRGVLCAKGSAGIMQHYSPARLSKPLLRVGERGSGEFREIEWDEALQLATDWLKPIRERNPDELAFFTGRDQSQALTGWWAQQFGTINYAAHGGFCSVNMAAGGLYTLGGSFWEFGEPDWEHSRYLMLWGVAEDHDSNPIKLGLGKLKGRGAKVVAINPVRTGYGAIADEWIGIRPGTDGLFAFALIHELLRNDRVDLEYLVRYTNAHWLVIRDPGAADDGLFARDAEGRALCWHVARDAATPASIDTPARQAGVAPAEGIDVSPAIVGDYTLPDGRRATPVFHLLAERYLDPQFAPEAVADTCGIPADTIRRIARELAAAAFDDPFSLPIEWTDSHGRTHAEMIGRPVSFHAMRGISAHSNGFHTCRAIHLLQLLLGAVDTPGSFRFQPPFPKPIPPANRPGRSRRDNGALDAAPLGFIHSPDDLLVDEHGRPRRIDHAYSWAYPLAAHGMMHSVIRNAWAGDPYRIDTLLMFMANMSWNSSMNTTQTMHMLTDRDADGAYRIPHIIYSDAYASEMVAYADLVLPDTTYLERHDCISLLDRPISDADAAADAIRQPVLATDAENPARDVRPFQSVLLDLGARLGLPGMVDANGAPAYRDFADYMVRHERAPGVGLLAGWRGADGQSHGKGPPNPQQLQRYIEHGGFWHLPVPASARYYKMANRDYLQWSQQMGFIGNAEPIVLQLYSETLQKFRLAAQGHGAVQPPPEHRARVATYFDPLPIWYETVDASAPSPASKAPLPPGEGLGRGFGTDSTPGSRPDPSSRVAPYAHAASVEVERTTPPEPSSAAARSADGNRPHRSPAGRGEANAAANDGNASKHEPFPLYAITQRPMFMYHAWGSQNAWLRQIATRNYLYLHPDTARAHGVANEDWVDVTSPNGTITVQVKVAANVQPDTVWTWNAIGKRKGAWRLAKDAPESTQGFLLNHLISERTRADDYANADPVTGQAAWFDLRVSIRKSTRTDLAEPQFAPLDLGTANNAPLRYGAGFRRKDHA
ncbi:molybdopterin oxidoreductase family protein [Chiayiivirga flava]|uniref:Anaerobic selenocysteine-containing dehydrogenase n=1 Tax=Chiayiivirga flava TaxID=659595 RepID=A0A7W8D9S6_9GAMM|nr:molybdopterin oxidoreductase family protein [Chiayiivirga flava]MBB5208758.1 anaerobic selenocysteine-containing dehydrogenase [Chiayiivirga flava]